MMALKDHRHELEARGITCIRGLIPPAAVKAARNMIYEIAQNHGLHTTGGWQRSETRFGVDKSFRAEINALNRSSSFPNLISESLIDVTTNLVGEPVTKMPPGSQILFSLPILASWSVPHDVWHVDVPRMGASGLPGLQVFTFLETVRPRGGGTLVVAGSHRLGNTSGVTRSKDLKRRLGRERYFRWLFDPRRKPIECLSDTVGKVDDVELNVVELSGQVGDVYFMDLRALHTPAPNASDTARIMLTCRFPKTAIASKLLNPDPMATN